MRVDYDRLAGDYDDVRTDEAADRGFWIPAIRDAGRLREGERILDLGAGTGRYARLLAAIGPVVAVDPSEAMLARAGGKGDFPRVLGDAHRLPFRDDAFDAVVAVMVVHQLRDLPAALRETARVGRRIAIATTDMEKRNLGVLAEAFPSLAEIDRSRFPRTESIVGLLEEAGYRHVAVTERILRRTLTVPQQIDRIRRKYISTLDLLPPGEFERGLAFLERELPRRYGNRLEFEAPFIFVGASR